jgi:hypothetical protein
MWLANQPIDFGMNTTLFFRYSNSSQFMDGKAFAAIRTGVAHISSART